VLTGAFRVVFRPAGVIFRCNRGSLYSFSTYSLHLNTQSSHLDI